MNKLIPDIKIPIINNDVISIKKLSEEFNNKKIVVFGVPGAFTPTCSEKHFPSFIKCYQEIINKKVDAIYCLSVNDQHVLRKWLQTYDNKNKIIGIADGNGDIARFLNLLVDKSKNFMGKRSARFAMIVKNNLVKKIFIDKPGEFNISSAQYILKELHNESD